MPALSIRRPFIVRGLWLLTGCLLAVMTACGDLDTPAFVDCAVTPDTLDFGGVTMGSSADRTFTVTNGGSEALDGSIRATCSDFSLVGSSSISIAKGASGTFTLRFAPTTTGSRSCRVSIASCGTLTTQGQGLPGSADCAVSPTSLSFGTVTVGSSEDRSFTITNNGNTQLTGTVTESCPEFSLVGGGDYDLAPSEDATITVRFAPTSGGAKSCSFDTQGLCADVSAGGTGQAPQADPQCAVSTDSLSFGTVAVGQSATRTFTITNAGGGTLSGTVSESCTDFSMVDATTYALGGGQSATFTVRFEPAGEGVQTCTIGTGSDCDPVTARGTGQILAPSCQIDTTLFDFREVVIGKTADRKVTITNGGLGILAGTLTESCDEFLIVGTASYSLGAVQSASFTLRFAPTVTGNFTCTVNPGPPCGPITLRGKGVPPPECELSAQSFDFGNVDVGKHEDHNFDIRNVGGGQLCGTATESCEGFMIQGGATYCAISGTPFRLRIRFQPPRAGTFECTVNPGAGCPPITVRGVGR